MRFQRLYLYGSDRDTSVHTNAVISSRPLTLSAVVTVRYATACRYIRLPASRSRLRLKCDGTRAETRFRLSAKRTSPFKSAGASVQSTASSRAVRISGSNAGYTMFRGSVKSTGTHSIRQFSHSLPLPCVTVCHHILTRL